MKNKKTVVMSCISFVLVAFSVLFVSSAKADYSSILGGGVYFSVPISWCTGTVVVKDGTACTGIATGYLSATSFPNSTYISWCDATVVSKDGLLCTSYVGGYLSNVPFSGAAYSFCTAFGIDKSGTFCAADATGYTASTPGWYFQVPGCPSGGTPSADKTRCEKQPILNFTSSTTSITSGSPVTLTWSTTNTATSTNPASCTATGAGLSNAPNGNFTLYPTSTTTYTITCTRTGFATVSQSITVTVSAPTCGSFSTSSWLPATCTAPATQSRTVTGIPAGCTGGTPPSSSQTCPAATTCTSFSYSGWSACSGGIQTRTVSSSLPAGCTGGSPVTAQSCVCTSWTYSGWGACQSDSTQTRSVLTSSPVGCAGGSPITSQGCTYVPIACTGSIATDGTMWAGDNTGLSSSLVWQYAATNTSTKCEFYCPVVKPNYKNGTNTCEAYACTGAIPSNSDWCALSDSGLSADTARQAVADCLTNKCAYKCKSGFVPSGNDCIAAPASSVTGSGWHEVAP